MIIAYKINFITHFLVKRMVKIKFANLVNLILNREVIPEMLQDNCEAKKICNKLLNLIEDENLSQKQIDDSFYALKLMGLEDDNSASFKAAREIIKLR